MVNDFFNVAPAMLDDHNMPKLISSDQMESYIGSASTSPVQDYIMAPSYHPQQQHHNQRQHQLQFPVATSMPTMTTHSAPSSPPYPIIKSEEVQSQNTLDYLLFPSSFDIPAQDQQQHHIFPSQRSPYTDVSLIQQRQQHNQQQQQHAQQLRLHFQQQQQMMYDTTPSHSTVTSMSIPATSSMMSTMGSATSSSSLFAPSAIATSAPFFHPSSLVQDDIHNVPSHSFQRLNTYSQHTQQRLSASLTLEPVPSSSASTSASTAAVAVPENALVTPPPTKKSSAAASSRLSTSSRLDKVKATRSTKVTKSTLSSSSSSISSTPSAADMISSATTETKTATTATTTRAIRKTSKKSTAPESRESSEQPETSTTTESQASRASGQTGNITHPRRAAQNRAAQRTFRNRRKAYIKELEQKVQEIDQTRELMKSIHNENQEVWRRLQILETLAAQSGVQMPTFSPLVPFVASGNEFASGNSNGAMGGNMMMSQGNNSNTMGSSNEEDEDDEDMSDSFSSHQQHFQQHIQHL
ncbi:hypothetical protein BGZ54_007507 [Gamsiella multidivaricata]|nr:hypothetical protein BGZ54_007507 [Gamsiella multidivaricata]